MRDARSTSTLRVWDRPLPLEPWRGARRWPDRPLAVQEELRA